MRTRSWAMVAALVLGIGSAGCNGSGDDGRTVAGRTRSLSRAADPAADDTPSARLRLRRSGEQATGAATARVVATLDVADPAAAILRLPTGEEVAMVASGARLVATIEGTPEGVSARCPPGGYTFAGRSSDGATWALTLEVVGATPSAPKITGPGDMALVAADAVHVAWSWDGTAALFDVDVTDVGAGEVVYHAVDVAGREHEVPPGALAPGRRYRLEVTSASAPSSAPVRLEATTSVVFDAVAP